MPPERQHGAGGDEEAIPSKWRTAFEALRQFTREHGRVPRHHETAQCGLEVGLWVSHLRMKQARIRRKYPAFAVRLAQLPGWTWKQDYEDRWLRMFEMLERYIEEKGALPTPREQYRGQSLGIWTITQRRCYANNQLSRERTELLESLPEWSWDPQVSRWLALHSLLKRFQREHGRLPRDSENYERERLGRWASFQRAAHARSALDEWRAELLEQVPGWVWNAHNSKWADKFSALREFYAQHRRLPRNSGKKTDAAEKKLIKWAEMQRSLYVKGTLRSDRRDALEALRWWKWSGVPGPQPA